MNGQEQIQNINFVIDKDTLYREESITDLKVGSIRRLIPIKTDGSADDAREEVFIGHTQLMSPEGPLPIQSELTAKTIGEAIEVFPATMKQALQEMIEKMQEMQKQQQMQQKDESRIIVPGR
jgi:hypothetical protein